MHFGRFCLILLGACLAASLAAAQAPERFLVESSLWLDGEAQTVPVLVVTAAEPGLLLPETVSEGGWRMEVQARPVDDPLSPSDSLWIEVTLSLFEDGQWLPLIDSMLGVPEGETATLSVVEEGQQASPETAQVYLQLKTSRLRPAD